MLVAHREFLSEKLRKWKKSRESKGLKMNARETEVKLKLSNQVSKGHVQNSGKYL